VIPPEFQGLGLADRSAGQVGGVSLGLEEDRGRTVFGHVFQQVPLRVLPPFHFPGEPAALAYLINPTAGLLDGDGHLVEISAGPGTRAVVTGQSAARIHPAVAGFGTQQWTVRSAAGSQLVLLPGPNIPFRGCRYFQRSSLELQGDARLIWGDIWTPGRYGRIGAKAEHHQFDRIVQELEVRRDGQLIHRDRFCWQGPWDEDSALWHQGERLHAPTATAGLFATGPVNLARAESRGGVSRAVLPLAHGDTLIRWCGPVAEVISHVVKTAFRLAAAWSGDPDAAPWLIGSNCLVPNHWFSAWD
jgi:urease accessory protein